MDVREKLVELIAEFVEVDAWDNGEFIEKDIDFCEIAEKLIDHGVTVQEWIPVDDRLPQKDGSYLVTCNYFGKNQFIDVLGFAKDGETVDKYDLAGKKYVWYFYDSEYGYVSTDSVTHWMPSPSAERRMIMATKFNTQVSNREYRLQFETDNKEHYLLMQSTARRCVFPRNS